MTDEQLFARGYIGPVKRFDGGRVACLMEINPFLYAIVTDLWNGGHDNAYYYRAERDAATALLAWDGCGEPSGWWRHPQSGRRRVDGDPAREYFQP